MARNRIRILQDPSPIVTDDKPTLHFAEDYKGEGPGWVLTYITADDDLSSKFFPGRDTHPSQVREQAHAWLKQEKSPGWG